MRKTEKRIQIKRNKEYFKEQMRWRKTTWTEIESSRMYNYSNILGKNLSHIRVLVGIVLGWT
jgi:hypothetical protein